MDARPEALRWYAARLAAALMLAVLATGCSTARFSVGHVMVPILGNARDAALASDDLPTFLEAAPANLFLMEGLIRTDPDNEALRIDAAMLYFSYAFAAQEDKDPLYASKLYLKGVRHGQAAVLKNRKLARDWSVPFESFQSSLASLRKRDVPAAAWTAANWSQFISLHLDSTAVLRDIPKVTALLERAAELDGTYFEGLPHVMIGSLHSFRPPLLGGSPEKSLESFEKAFAVSGSAFLLPRYFFARFYLYRIQDADQFRRILQELIAAPVSETDRYRLLNLIAKQKSAGLLGEADELF